MSDWNIKDLEKFDGLVFEKIRKIGLDCYDQEFHLCDPTEMLGYMAYSGIPSHYPHWSYGKSYERTRTMYDHGVSGLPYEMVINSDPAIAYLMRDNSLCLQMLTIAHVYGHNDFFKNNFTFQGTDARNTLSRFRAHANLVRAFIEDPSIGFEAVEKTLDAAHALAFQCRRNLHIRKLTVEEEREKLLSDALPREDPYSKLHKRKEFVEPDLNKNPPVPDEDILLFIANNNPFLKDWQKKLIQIVHEEAQYFIPQIDTKIMNEGWASYWHRRIFNELSEEKKIAQGIMLEFFVRHNQVVRPIPGSINPYNVGLTLWTDIGHRYDEAMTGKICEDHQIEYDRNGAPGDLGRLTGDQKIFEVRSADRDTSFLRRFLNEHLIGELDLFKWETKENKETKKNIMVVSDVPSRDSWKKIKESLLKNIGTNGMPVIKVVDGNVAGNRSLYLKHDFDGRELLSDYAKKTMEHIYFLWNGNVYLETNFSGENKVFIFNDKGFGMKPRKDVKEIT